MRETLERKLKMEKSLPTIKASTILAHIQIARRAGTPGKFVLQWIEQLSSEGKQPELCASIVELIDGFFEDDAEGKVNCASVLGIILNSIIASVEAEKLEEMFEETA
tara:strand:+ start:313 stop:633 length:321 start_codon:yes stop_codon:yes gene_type:complete